MSQEPDHRDIADELDDWAYIIDNAQGKAHVVMLSGEVYRNAASEIRRLRKVVDSYRRRLNGVVDL